MKKKIISIAIALCLVIGLSFFAGMKVAATGADAGSLADPLVSKSYLDSRLGAFSGTMTKVTVAQNEVLKLSEGGKIVVFSGNGKVSGEGFGLINTTTGELTQKDINLAKYNSYLVPDAATTITATSSLVLFVAGTYTISK